MKVIIEEKNIRKINKFVDWLIHMIGYAVVLIILSIIIPSFNISNQYFGLYGLLATIIIYILNKTIKPIIFYLTLPLTGITFGLFYPFINVLILYIVDLILGNKFELGNIFIALLVAILISIMNFLIEAIIIKPILKVSNNDN